MRGQCEEVATLSAAAALGFLLKRPRWWCSRGVEGEGKVALFMAGELSLTTFGERLT